ncbi:hypothetical protein BOX15_Mlig012000g1 [Macrostomum lignano]|uniref:Sarcolemmal membrane-associated protein n=2 Tax=Macrostomum lignano TaxID=282301 RepID=A0A267G9G6_9PLAT|nr:hypothetical protein BOX15_Mlig012000g1 [Macrostomum lignano]
MSVYSMDSNDSDSSILSSATLPDLDQASPLQERQLNGSHVAKACFKCRPQSHPFSERQVPVVELIKIGRSVAKSKPDAGNAIFDCKVLSRNHAVLWYEDGKFWLKDTKSSNGTFVNNQRLGKGNEESAPRELYSGDIVQLGVDVMENTKKVTHGCIIAQVTLFHPDGSEARRPPTSAMTTASGSGGEGSSGGPGGPASAQANSVNQEQLYQLSQYLQEALHRENTIGAKLDKFCELLDCVGALGDASWSAVLNEERLLARLELLENQLALARSNSGVGGGNDGVRDCLQEAVERQAKAEEALKARLDACLAERGQALERAGQLERGWLESRDEARELRDACGQAREQLQALSAQYDRDTGQLKQELAAAKQEGAALAGEIRDLGGALVDQSFADLDRQLQAAEQPDKASDAAAATAASTADNVDGDGAGNSPPAASAAALSDADSSAGVSGGCGVTTAQSGVRISVPTADTAVQAADDSSSPVTDEPAEAELRTQLQVYRDLVAEQQDALDVSGRNVANLHRQLESALTQISQLESQLPQAEAEANQPEVDSQPDAEVKDPDADAPVTADWLIGLLRRLRADADSLARAEQLLSAAAAAPAAPESAAELRSRLADSLAETDRLRADYAASLERVAAAEADLEQGRRERDRLAEQCRELQAASRQALDAERLQLQRLTERNRLLSAAAALPLLILLVSLTVSLYTWLTGR